MATHSTTIADHKKLHLIDNVHKCKRCHYLALSLTKMLHHFKTTQCTKDYKPGKDPAQTVIKGKPSSSCRQRFSVGLAPNALLTNCVDRSCHNINAVCWTMVTATLYIVIPYTDNMHNKP